MCYKARCSKTITGLECVASVVVLFQPCERSSLESSSILNWPAPYLLAIRLSTESVPTPRSKAIYPREDRKILVNPL